MSHSADQSLARKLCLLQRPFVKIGTSAKAFARLEPVEAVGFFRRHLPKELSGALRFAFSDVAFHSVLEADFRIEESINGNEQLVFIAKSLEPEAILRACGLSGAPPEALHRRLLARADWLVTVTRPLFSDQLAYYQFLDIQADFLASLWAYVDKYAPGRECELLDEMADDPRKMVRYANATIIDALYKADACSRLLGPQAGYTVAWRQKQYLRYLVAQAVETHCRPLSGG